MSFLQRQPKESCGSHILSGQSQVADHQTQASVLYPRPSDLQRDSHLQKKIEHKADKEDHAFLPSSVWSWRPSTETSDGSAILWGCKNARQSGTINCECPMKHTLLKKMFCVKRKILLFPSISMRFLRSGKDAT